MDKAAIKQIVNRFSAELARMGIGVEQVLLFGSHATGTAQEGSDIDLIVISADWEPYSQRERLEMLGVAAARILEPVQAKGFTPQEIASRKLMPFWEHFFNEQASPV